MPIEIFEVVMFVPVLKLPGRAALFGLVALTCVFTGAASHAEETVVVNLDQAKVLQLPEKTATVIIGNPGVADITFLKRANTLVLTGKSFGQTNLLALDATGKALGETQVRVANGPGALIVQLGSKRVSYSCSPRCQPTLALGDDTTYTGDVTAQVQLRNQFAAPAAK
jgi:Flp pilus assembly secretin CpaC